MKITLEFNEQETKQGHYKYYINGPQYHGLLLSIRDKLKELNHGPELDIGFAETNDAILEIFKEMPK